MKLIFVGLVGLVACGGTGSAAGDDDAVDAARDGEPDTTAHACDRDFPNVDFCDDFDDLPQLTPPFGFDTFPVDDPNRATLVMGASFDGTQALRLSESNGTPVTGRVRELPLSITSNITIRFDVQLIKHDGTLVELAELGMLAGQRRSAVRLRLTPEKALRLVIEDGAGRVLGPFAVPGQLVDGEWTAIALDIQLVDAVITLALDVGPSGAPPSRVFTGQAQGLADPPQSAVLDVGIAPTPGRTEVVLDMVVVDVR